MHHFAPLMRPGTSFCAALSGLLTATRRLLTVGVLCTTLASAQAAKTWYVSIDSGKNYSEAAGFDGSTAAKAFRTLDYVQQFKVQPGDTVRIVGSTTGQTYPWMNIYKGGSLALGRITYIADNMNNRPLVTFDGAPAGVRVTESYVTVDGIRVRGVASNSSADITAAKNHGDAVFLNGNSFDPHFDGDGVLVTGSPGNAIHDVTIRNCETWLCPGSGIGAQYADYTLIELNNVHENCYWTPYGKSGINLYQLTSYGTATGTKVTVRRNRSWGNRLYVPWVDAPGGPAITDGNGIIVDVSNGSGYNGIVRLENNLCYRNGGRGINITSTSRVEIVNNTTFSNAKSSEISTEFVVGYGSDNVKVYNNIFWATDGKGVRITPQIANLTSRNNIYYGGSVTPVHTSEYNNVDPKLIWASGLNFDLQSTSPAINHGFAGPSPAIPTVDFDGQARGTLPDIGAHEY